ncbi:hypothetical protein [Gordonia sp. FQ]
MIVVTSVLDLDREIEFQTELHGEEGWRVESVNEMSDEKVRIQLVQD